MKKHNLVLAVLMALTGLSVAQAEDISLFDYEEASSAYEEAYVAGTVNVSKKRGDDQTAYDLNLDIDYDKVVSTPDRDVTMRADATGGVKRDGTAGADSIDNYTAGASVTVDNYFRPGSNGGFWYGSGSVRANDSFDDLETTAGVGVGYGRVTNVTPMAKAMRVVDELLKRNAITAKPSKAVYQSIAKIISRESEYRSKYGYKDYAQKWVADIADELTKAGLTNGSVNVAGILKARDVLIDEKISTRLNGWKVRAGVAYVGQNFDGLTDKPALEMGAEYHKPLSNRTQFSNEAVARAIINDGDNAYNVNNKMSLTHEVDDRIDWENSWGLDYAHSSVNGDDVTTNTLSSTFAYELSNSLDFTTTAQLSHVNGSSSATNPDGTDRALLMGVRYRLR